MPRLLHLPLLVLSLAGGCVGGTDVFQGGTDDGGTMECERPEPVPTATNGFWIESSSESVGGACAPPLLVDDDGRASCTVIQASPTAAGGCAGLPGRTLRGLEDADGQSWEICELTQVAAGGSGWWYSQTGSGETSPASEHCASVSQWLTFDPAFESGTRFTVACTTAEAQQGNGLGARCMGHEERFWGQCGIHAPSPLRIALLTCDAVTDQCTVPCESDADCAAVGLEGEHCAERGVCVPDDCS